MIKINKFPKCILYGILAFPLLFASKTTSLAWNCNLPIEYTSSTGNEGAYAAIDYSGLDVSTITNANASITSTYLKDRNETNAERLSYSNRYHEPI